MPTIQPCRHMWYPPYEYYEYYHSAINVNILASSVQPRVLVQPQFMPLMPVPLPLRQPITRDAASVEYEKIFGESV
jgi:hypothetical protein